MSSKPLFYNQSELPFTFQLDFSNPKNSLTNTNALNDSKNRLSNIRITSSFTNTYLIHY